MEIAEWENSGVKVNLVINGISRQIFIRQSISDPTHEWITFLHGFPTCSWDYYKILPYLEKDYNILLFDFLGFGLSDKPKNYPYSIIEQANLVKQLWEYLEINKTHLIAHDYGATVAQELLASEVSCIRKVVLLNGGLYPHLHRPILIQKILRNKLLGPIVTQLINKKAFTKNFQQILANPIEFTEIDQLWDFIKRDKGNLLYHRLIHYIADRELNEQRWVKALENQVKDLKFIWGTKDPISGAHMIDHIELNVPNADIVRLEQTGHYPQTESHELVGPEICNFFKVP